MRSTTKLSSARWKKLASGSRPLQMGLTRHTPYAPRTLQTRLLHRGPHFAAGDGTVVADVATGGGVPVRCTLSGWPTSSRQQTLPSVYLVLPGSTGGPPGECASALAALQDATAWQSVPRVCKLADNVPMAPGIQPHGPPRACLAVTASPDTTAPASQIQFLVRTAPITMGPSAST